MANPAVTESGSNRLMTLYIESKSPTMRRTLARLQCEHCGHYYPPTVYFKHAHLENPETLT